MTSETDNLILEHLRQLRNDITNFRQQVTDDMADIKNRLSGVESGMALVTREFSFSQETDARQQVSIDKIVARIERIERRLELTPNHDV